MTTILDFIPHPCFPGGHLQTLVGFYWPETLPTYQATATPVDVSDGDQIMIHDDCPEDWSASDQVALLVHGLAGCHGSPYMVRIAARLRQLGTRCFRMDMRGCGAACGRATSPGHAGRFSDVIAAIHKIRQTCPHAPLVLVGFSMGGNLVLNTLAQATHEPVGNLVAGIAVAPPVDLERCCRELTQGLGRYYDIYLVRRLLNNWQATGGALPEILPKSIFEFDDRITAPRSGYRSAEEYYAAASSGPRLAEITLPTKILAARDDPVVACAAVESAPRSSAVELFLTKSGGHLGFMSRRGTVPRGRWMDQQVVDWVLELRTECSPVVG